MKNNIKLSAAEVDYLLSPEAIRAQAKAMFAFCQKNKSQFVYRPEKLKPTVDYVLQVIKNNYPDMNIPSHSRWGHFRVGGIDRVKDLNEKLSGLDTLEKARAKIDLVIISSLLDAGAGSDWKYVEGTKVFTRSEGLGVASFHMFLSGAVSDDQKSPRVDAAALRKFTAEELEKYFQVDKANPLVGVAGRIQLLNNLATALENKKIFKDARPGNIIDYLKEKFGDKIPATGILRAVLDGLGPIWPGRIMAAGVNLGDVWQHSTLAPADSIKSLIPIHKLSQWMTYSLIEPIQEAGLEVTGIENLTGLAEYRNGGLMIDSGLLSLRKSDSARKPWGPESDLIIEWRALTVHLLDLIADEVRLALKKTPEEFPLAKVLEGGTWWAGRFLAQQKRAGSTPPLQIQSDGTVF